MITPWKELSRRLAFEKHGRRIDEVMFEMPDGTQADFYIRDEGETVAILALTADKRIILVKQFRPGPQTILNEMPGGFIDKDETPEVAAARELLEETGYRGELRFVATSFDDAYSNMRRHCFIATNCQKVSEPQQTSTEQVEVVTLSLAEFRAQLQTGQMTDMGIGYLCLDKLSWL